MPDKSQLKKLADDIFYQMWNHKKIDLVDQLFAEKFEIHYSVHCINSHADFKNLLQHWFSGIPDLKHTIDDYIIGENKIVLRWHGEGTHKGTFLDIPATNKPFYYSGITIFEVNQNGKIIKAWLYNDLTDTILKLK